jgi:hypothetical protein
MMDVMLSSGPKGVTSCEQGRWIIWLVVSLGRSRRVGRDRSTSFGIDVAIPRRSLFDPFPRIDLKSQKNTSTSRKDTTSLLVNPTFEVDNSVTALASSHQPAAINPPIENFSAGRAEFQSTAWSLPSGHLIIPRGQDGTSRQKVYKIEVSPGLELEV